METSEYAVEVRKIEEKHNVMENSYAMFQIREAVGRLQMFFKIGVLENFVSLFSRKFYCWKGLQLY